MSISDQNKRLSLLSRVPHEARLDHRLISGEMEKRHAGMSRSERRKLEKDARRLTQAYKQIIERNFKSGAGYPVDALLRHFVNEYTNRYASSGLYTQPVSFNYIEPFCKIDFIERSIAPFASPLKELNHLFSFADFFDFITSSDVKIANFEELGKLQEDIVFHFTANGSVLDFSVRNDEGREFLFAGFSFVRRGNSLHWYMLGGEVLSDEEWKERCGEGAPEMDLENTPPWKIGLVNEIANERKTAGDPLPLEGTTTAMRTIIAGEIDLISQKILGRCHMIETEHTFMMRSDDPIIFDYIKDEEARQAFIEENMQAINSAKAMWDLSKALFALPQYFKHRLKVQERILVERGQKKQSFTSKGGKGLKHQFKTVTAVEFVSDDGIVSSKIDVPHFMVETEGHWRRLKASSIGTGPNGESVTGRTWVKARNTWRDEVDQENVVYVKSLISSAQKDIQELVEAPEGDFDPAASGVVYVMRNPAMEEGIYKVGWTSGTAINRARELSAATGVAIPFYVVKSWVHDNPEGLETAVHAALLAYRVNNRREYFKAPLETIVAIVNAEIARGE
ncbi:GIY-YIG nuclease family protein [Thalassovita mediterranea]|nr:GIY-YIG nuclease family protein [Thalassovita mediterranea]